MGNSSTRWPLSFSEQLDSIQLQESPSHVIIHVGTNNLPTDTAKTCSTKIGKLANHIKVKFPQSKVEISGLTIRKDCDLDEKLNQTNKDLRSLCIRQGYTFIDNANINSSALNSSKLHLNPKGTAYFAVNFSKFSKYFRMIVHLWEWEFKVEKLSRVHVASFNRRRQPAES